jgi:hypothetical protein
MVKNRFDVVPRASIRVAALFLLVGLSTPASAALVTFTNRAAFDAAVGTLPVESFETTPVTGVSALSSLTLGPLTITGSPNFGILNAPLVGVAATGGTQYLIQSTSTSVPSTLTFSFSSSLTAFGLDILDWGDFGGGVTGGVGSLTFTDNVGDTVLVDASPPLNADGNVSFFGVISTSALNSVTLTSTQLGDAYGVDRVAFGNPAPAQAPEPLSLALLGTAVGALAVVRRRGAKKSRC